VIRLKLINYKNINNKVAFLVFANLTQKFFTFSAFALVSKFLSREEYGTYVYYLLIIGIVLELANAGLFQGIQNDISKKSTIESERQKSINASYTSTLVLSLFCFLFVILFYSFNKEKFSYQGFNSNILALIFFIFILTSSLNSLGNIVFIALQKSKLFFLSVLFQGFTLLTILTFLLFFKFQNANTVLIVFSFSYFISSAFQIYKIKPRLSIQKSQFIEVFNKGKWYVMWSFISVLESRTDIYLLSKNSNFTSIATFDIASKYMIIGQIITTILSQKFLPELLANTERLSIEKQLKKSTIFLIPALALLIIPIGLFIRFFYAGKYDVSIVCYIILTIALIFNMLNINNTSKLISNNFEKYLFILSLITFVLKLPIAIFLVSKYNVIGASVSTSITQILSFFVFYGFIKKYFTVGNAQN
jgi:O-antigen/teichoic acid export membrane protein